MGCRTRAQADSLLRVVAQNGAVVPDPSATLPGRGAWVHPRVSCVELAAKRKAFGRALRVTTALGTDQVFAAI
ncbi:MAG TPA: YlxR family protein [Galbitalea sp.]|nr:YlxR family protein [Galbitalea sp.]